MLNKKGNNKRKWETNGYVNKWTNKETCRKGKVTTLRQKWTIKWINKTIKQTTATETLANEETQTCSS